jgi:hypothetical protein
LYTWNVHGVGEISPLPGDLLRLDRTIDAMGRKLTFFLVLSVTQARPHEELIVLLREDGVVIPRMTIPQNLKLFLRRST